MSSFSKDVFLFWKYFILWMGLVVALNGMIVWRIDPFNLVSDISGNLLYEMDGITGNNDRVYVPLLAMNNPVERIVTGNSRVLHGFKSEFWPNTYETLNLSISMQTVHEMTLWLPQVIKNRTTKEVWIGLDFGMFFYDEPIKNVIPNLSTISKLSKWYYQFGPEAIVDSYLALFNYNCNVPNRDPYGFVTSCHRFGNIEQPTRVMMLDLMIENSARYSALKLTTSMDEFIELIKLLQINDISIKLFLSPSHPTYYEAIEAAGKMTLYRKWMYQVEENVKRFKAQGYNISYRNFTMIDEPQGLEKINCENFHNSDCSYYDLVHFKPVLGKPIIESFYSGILINEQ